MGNSKKFKAFKSFSHFPPIWKKFGEKIGQNKVLEVNGSTRQPWKKVCIYGGGFRSLWRENGRVGKSGEWLAGIMVGVGGVCGCVCVQMWVCMMWLREKSTSQSSGRPDFKRLTAEREGGSRSSEAKVNAIQIFLSFVTDQTFFLNFCICCFIYILDLIFYSTEQRDWTFTLLISQ